MSVFPKMRVFCVALGLGVAALCGPVGLAPAHALPPGGAATSNTPGTSSSVSPASLQAGDTLTFSVSGFPAGEQLYIKVDDGAACPSDAAQGACVVHQQKISSNGTASGSFILSKELSEGPHTLRFLATEIMYDADGNYQGSKGYTNRSPEFTISGVNESSSGGTTVNVDPSVINSIEENVAQAETSNQNQMATNPATTDSQNQETTSSSAESSVATVSTDTAADGTTIYLDAEGNPISQEEYEALLAQETSTASASESQQASPSATMSPTTGESSTASAQAQASASQEPEEETAASIAQQGTFPWVGALVFGASIIVAAFVLLRRHKTSEK